jgi:hypothetical protein
MLQDLALLSQFALTAYYCDLAGCKLRVIVFEAWEQVTVHVKRHLDRAMTKQRLQPLRRKALLDRPRREEMSERV